MKSKAKVVVVGGGAVGVSTLYHLAKTNTSMQTNGSKGRDSRTGQK